MAVGRMFVAAAFHCIFSTLCAGNLAEGDVVLEIRAMLNKNTTIRETFYTNVEENTVMMQFQLNNGLICYTVYDFQNGVKVFKVDVLGETELGQKQYQSICFVTKLNKEDIIPSDSMAKLRQKTSGSVQEANSVLLSQEFSADIELVHIANSRNIVGEKFHRLCSGRDTLVYAKESELFSLAKEDVETWETLKLNHLLKRPNTQTKCSLKTTNFVPCLCKIPFTIPWYPCVIKYCSTKNPQGRVITTRCGIKSCKVTHYLNFVANHPLSCHWGVT